jgi:N-acetylglucosaminyl-diphospho-decaprenol L-rhamnosyltransferase
VAASLDSAGAADTAILIVAYRSRATMDELAAALNAQTVRPREILVLENGSPDGERVDAGQLPQGARLIGSETNLGFAPGNNRLAGQATAEWLILLNPDAFPDPDWLEKMMAAAVRHPGASLFGCTQRAHGAQGVLDGAGDVYHATGLPYRAGYGRRMAPPPEGEVFGPCGAALMIRRSLFAELGGFDEAYFCYVEDVDLAFRARLRGHRAIQVRDAAVSHMGYASSGRRSEFATYHGARNRLWTFVKNMPGWLFWLLLPVHAGVTLLLWLSAARFGQAGVFGRAIRDALKDGSGLMAKRREVQAARTVSAAQVAPMMAWNPARLLTRAPHVRPVDPA